jgi:hypothetical protein
MLRQAAPVFDHADELSPHVLRAVEKPPGGSGA